MVCLEMRSRCQVMEGIPLFHHDQGLQIPVVKFSHCQPGLAVRDVQLRVCSLQNVKCSLESTSMKVSLDEISKPQLSMHPTPILLILTLASSLPINHTPAIPIPTLHYFTTNLSFFACPRRSMIPMTHYFISPL